MTEVIQDLLKHNPYFASFSGQDLGRIARIFRERRYERGDYLFLEGDQAHWAGMIAEGRVKLIKHSGTGKDLVLDVLGPGRFIGTTSLAEDEVCPTTAQAMEPTRVLSLARQDLLVLFRDHPAAAMALVSDLSLRLKEAYEMMRSLALERVEKRVALNLVKLAGKAGIQNADGSILIDLPLTRQDIAEMAGTTIESAIRTMSKFQKMGLVESEDGKVRLRKPHQMVLVAEDLA